VHRFHTQQDGLGSAPWQRGRELLRRHGLRTHRERLPPVNRQTFSVDSIYMRLIPIHEQNGMSAPQEVGTRGASDGARSDY